ncbi:protein kinase [Cystobacter fuscus]|uniref:protein kinase domain-containing protein n=1 Tax=Cystobacter fuscus TaxID=43 RepID=UPI0037C09339
MVRAPNWPPSPVPVPGERLGGPDGQRFEIQQALGGGAMGMVYRAWDAALQRIVALKFLQPLAGPLDSAAVGLLQQEARAVARLNHENIVKLFDVAEWNIERGGPRVPFLVMEYLQGESLAELLRRGRPGMKRAMEIMEAVAAGLAHAHRRNLVHRDLKPANVFLSREGTVKLLDFGLAHRVVGASPVPSLPKAGTPAYMAPEQWRGAPQDQRADIWAAGVLLYELLTGTLPFPDLSIEQIRERVLSPEPMPSARERCPELAPEVEPLLASALAKDPARRLPSGQELLEELRELGDRLGLHREPARPSSPQRRQVTLVCCMPMGLPELPEPEDRDELEVAFHEACAELLGRCGGSVTLPTGAQVLACFGYPQAHEDDSKHAVQAGLLLSRSFPRLLEQKLRRLPPAGLSVAVGIHTDTVVVHESPHALNSGAPVLAGEAPEVAAWLARQARPGTVLLTEATHSLVRGAFELEALGTQAPVGLATARSVRVYRALSERKEQSRFERTRAAFGLTPLVGREQELREVLGLWERARQGNGTAVLLRGEAGLGKSRLIHEVHVRVASSADGCLSAECDAQFTSSPLFPIIEVLRRLLQEALPEGISPSSLRRLKPRLHLPGLSEAHLRALSSLLSLPSEEELPFPQLTPERQKSLVFEALAALLRSLARERPILAIVENLHWADPSTLEFLAWLLGQVRQSRVLLLLSSRPELRYPPLQRAGGHVLTLNRLSEEHAGALVRKMTQGHPLGPEIVQQLVKRTEGVPLFAEELTRMVLEQQVTGVLPASIPMSLHELLLARMDALPPRQKGLAQFCAVVGRSFSGPLLAALTEQSEAMRSRDLEGLMAAGILQQEDPVTGPPEYRFRHALIQEAAWQSLARSTRREYHQRIAEGLAERCPEIVESRPELLAHHYTEAGQHLRAIAWWARAGEHASQRSAHQEAIGHLTQALKLLRGLPDADQHKGQELHLQLMLGVPLVQMQGYQSPAAEQSYARAHVLFDEVGEALPRLELSYWGPFDFYMARGELLLAQQLAERLVSQGPRHRELLALGQWMESVVALTRGQGRAARAHVQRALECSRFSYDEHRALARRHWVDPRVAALAQGSIILTFVGELEGAHSWGEAALELAGRIGHLHTSAAALHSVALGCQYRGDAATTLELAERCLALSSEHRFRLWQSWSVLLRSWALAGLGWSLQGLALMRQGLEQWHASGIRAGENHHNLGMLAEIHLWRQQPRQALDVVDQALARLGGERFYESVLYRLRAESLHALGREQEAEASFLSAIKVAREQGALAFEHRARQSRERRMGVRNTPAVPQIEDPRH